MFRKFFTLIGTIGIVVGGGFLIVMMASMRPKIEPKEPDILPPTVFFTIAEETSVTLDVTAQGEVRPRTDISLTAQVAGQIVSTSSEFVNGGAFEEGDTLIKIEDAPYRATAAAARARLAQEQAEASLARRDYEELGRVADPTDLALRLPQLAQVEAEYRAAQLNLDRTTIRAPFKGRVRERIAGVGQYVAPGAQLGRIFSTDIAEIRFPLNDNDLAKLGLPIAFTESKDNPGPPVIMTAFIAGQEHKWVGRIERTDGAIDPTTRQIFAIAVVDDPYGKGSDNGTPLAMGLYVNATIEGKPYEAAMVLPRSALYGRDTVYVINGDDTVTKRTVTVVSAEKDFITISSGVEDGEKVVTSPLRGAGEGDKVTPVDPAAIKPTDQNLAESSGASERTSSGDH